LKSINVYIITYGPHRIEEEKKCIEKAHRAAKHSKYNVNLYICDNNSPKEFTEWLTKVYSNTENFHIHLHPENIGKARIVNLVHGKSPYANYFVSMDSDMIIEDGCDDFFDEMIHGLGKKISVNGQEKEIGVVSSQQLKHPCHLWSMIKINQMIEGKEFRTSGGGGIAGGCMALKTDTWDKIGGYKEFKSIFGGNDGYVMRKVIQIGKIPVIAMEAKAVHVGAHNTPELKRYHNWKVQQSGNINKGEFKPNSGYFD
jgi:GT2 family glycosyltransferase